MATLLSPNQFVFKALKGSATIWCGLMIALLILLSTAASVNAAPGYVTIINQSDKTIWVAWGRFVPFSNEMAMYSPEHMVFNGWYGIEPGSSSDFRSGGFYVMQNGSRQSWPNLKEWDGLARPTARFDNVEISTGTNFGSYYSELNRFLAAHPDYKRFTYQSLAPGSWSVTTPTQRYRVLTRTFSFDFRSHASNQYNQCYSVPGTVVNYEIKAQRLHGPVDNWTQNTGSVCVSVTVEGYQPYYGAAREQGYFVGSLTVHYTVPIP